MKTPPDKRLIITFHSHQTKDRAMWWKAQVVFEPGSVADTILQISVVDGLDVPVAAGVLELAGQRLEVHDGKTQISYRDFIAGKHEKALWLYRDNMLPIPGALTFA